MIVNDKYASYKRIYADGHIESPNNDPNLWYRLNVHRSKRSVEDEWDIEFLEDGYVKRDVVDGYEVFKDVETGIIIEPNIDLLTGKEYMIEYTIPFQRIGLIDIAFERCFLFYKMKNHHNRYASSSRINSKSGNNCHYSHFVRLLFDCYLLNITISVHMVICCLYPRFEFI